jgi:hypothetical protein
MKVHTSMGQGSVEWSQLRAGKVTASEMDRLVSPLGKVRTGEGPRTYLALKLAEKWTGGPMLSLQGIFDVDQGQILEEYAKPAFTFHTGIEINNVAFIESDCGRYGCSPDGMIDETTGVEIKCPRMETHIGYLLDGELPSDYVCQVQGSMFVTGGDHWHFMSYCRRLPPLIIRVERDEKIQSSLEAAISAFAESMDAGFKILVEKNGGPPKPRFNVTTAQMRYQSDPNDLIP